jgi:hypothetical protein
MTDEIISLRNQIVESLRGSFPEGPRARLKNKWERERQIRFAEFDRMTSEALRMQPPLPGKQP